MLPHEVLGVRPDASTEEIKAAWRSRVKETHSDRGGSDDDFRAVQEAFETMMRQRHGGEMPTWAKQLRDQIQAERAALLSEVHQAKAAVVAGNFGDAIRHGAAAVERVEGYGRQLGDVVQGVRGLFRSLGGRK